MNVPYYDDGANWSLIPHHMHESVHAYVMTGRRPGEFLTAIFSNDFMEAAGRADDQNLAALAGWAKFLYNHVPGRCKGSPEAVRYWITAHGVLGGA